MATIFLRLAAVLALAASCSACNTVEGLGKDIQKGGEVIQKSAK
jgi:entericidin B